jgi:hypothetical protein
MFQILLGRMKAVTKVVAIAALASVVFAAIFLMLGVTFEFKGWEVVADNGVFLNISYSTNQSVTATLTDSDNKVVDQAVFPAGDGHGQLRMVQGEDIPAPGAYRVTLECRGSKIYDSFFAVTAENILSKIYENFSMLSGPYLSIENIQVLQWGEENNLATIENVSLGLANSGDLPVYVYCVSVNGQPTWVGAVESWIMPGRRMFSWNWSEPALQPGVQGWIIKTESVDGETITQAGWMVGVPTVEQAEAGTETWSGTVTTTQGWHVIDTRSA